MNPDLIECYETVRDHPEPIIERLHHLSNNKGTYLRVRAARPTTPVGRAARFLYLTRLSFNGIYRVNLRGAFNVPYGWKKHLDVVQEAAIRATSASLAKVTLRCADFEAVLNSARKGDFVYLDPPYTVAHENNGFLKYNAKVFSWTDQARLASLAERLAARGCHLLITNACHDSIRHLYRDLRQVVVRRVSRISADPMHRGPVNELIITNIPPK